MRQNEVFLIKKAAKGDVDAFEMLIEEYQKKVYNIALGILKNHDDANDIAQEVFIKIFKSIKNFKGESSFSTWIFRITTNACLDEIRKRKNNQTVSTDENIVLDDGEVTKQIIDDGPSPDEIYEKNELKKYVAKAISNLGEEHRTVIVLRDIQGFSYDEIADILDCPKGTVKSRINRARLMLKDILKKDRELYGFNFVK